MDNKWKTGIAIALVVLLASLAMVIKYQRDMINNQQTMEKSMIEMKQLQDGIVRSQSKYVTKDGLERFAKNSNIDLKPIKKDLDKLDADLEGISTVLAKTPGHTVKNVASTETAPAEEEVELPVALCSDGTDVTCPDTFGYHTNVQKLKLNEPFNDEVKVPLGEVEFRAWKEKPWSYEIKPREYSAVTVLSTDEEGRHIVHNKLTIKVDGEDHVIPINSSEFVEIYPEAKFGFEPRLYLGVDGGIYVNDVSLELAPNLQLAMFAYGQPRLPPELTFLGLGLGYMSQKNNVALMISPINYNVAQHLPFVENVYVGPSFTIDLKQQYSIMLGVRVGL